MGLKNLFHRKKKHNNNDEFNNEINNDEIITSRTSTNGSNRDQIEKELEQVFKKFDVNGDGRISWSELGSIMGSLGHRPGDDELKSMISEVDTDSDGFIDLPEFIALNTNNVELNEALENLKSAFAVFDVDKNGLISAEELQKVLVRLEEECTVAECRRMIAGVDVNGDGMISFEEFRVMMMSGTRFDGIGSKRPVKN